MDKKRRRKKEPAFKSGKQKIDIEAEYKKAMKKKKEYEKSSRIKDGD